MRALAILFVIIGHQIPEMTPYFVFTSPIKIPLFFMITGYVFNYSRTGFLDFLKNLLRKIVVPWLCLTIPFAVMKIPFSGLSAFPTDLYEIISGETAWYMPCCVIAEIIWFLINKATSKFRIVLVLGVSVLGIICGNKNVFDFFMINRAMVAQFFILLGFFYKQYAGKLVAMKWQLLLLFAVVFLCLGVMTLWIWPGKCMDVHTNYYYNYVICFSMIVLGGLVLFSVAMRFGITGVKFPKYLLFVGKNTIVYYLLHPYNISLFGFALKLLHITFPKGILVVFNVFFAIIMCGIETRIINSFFPWILGPRENVQSHKSIICS